MKSLPQDQQLEENSTPDRAEDMPSLDTDTSTSPSVMPVISHLKSEPLEQGKYRQSSHHFIVFLLLIDVYVALDISVKVEEMESDITPDHRGHGSSFLAPLAVLKKEEGLE